MLRAYSLLVVGVGGLGATIYFAFDFQVPMFYFALVFFGFAFFMVFTFMKLAQITVRHHGEDLRKSHGDPDKNKVQF